MRPNSRTDDIKRPGMTYSESGYGTSGSSEKRSVLSASSLAGDDVVNTAGEDLGEIKELMIDIGSGRVAYAVLSFGGMLGIGNKLFAIPWSKLRVDEDRKCFVLDVDKETLEQAPGFDKDNWPDMSDPGWGSQIYTHYNATPYWGQTGFVAAADRVRFKTPARSRAGIFCLRTIH